MLVSYIYILHMCFHSFGRFKYPLTYCSFSILVIFIMMNTYKRMVDESLERFYMQRTTMTQCQNAHFYRPTYCNICHAHEEACNAMQPSCTGTWYCLRNIFSNVYMELSAFLWHHSGGFGCWIDSVHKRLWLIYKVLV